MQLVYNLAQAVGTSTSESDALRTASEQLVRLQLKERHQTQSGSMDAKQVDLLRHKQRTLVATTLEQHALSNFVADFEAIQSQHGDQALLKIAEKYSETFLFLRDFYYENSK